MIAGECEQLAAAPPGLYDHRGCVGIAPAEDLELVALDVQRPVVAGLLRINFDKLGQDIALGDIHRALVDPGYVGGALVVFYGRRRSSAASIRSMAAR